MIKEGRIIEMGEKGEILNHPKDPYTKNLIEAAALQ
jgi:ABC-type oligopeptide transport system ATPase subunit